ncbi:MAG: hypothetical protein ACU0A2_15015 [Cognatishimia sp.]|uniref:hypothetical protein n=1 Tax=Cognatishimia sp. TaxID=2211648 RepID=UPI004059EA56
MEKSRTKARYQHALLSTLIGSALHPLIMAFMNNDAFSMAGILKVAMSDTPFFLVFFAALNFGFAWLLSRQDKKRGLEE